MVSVGIRHLKANLSKTLQTVRKGARVEVTEHGRPIAIIIPIGPASDLAWAHRLVVTKRAHWNGGKPRGYFGKPTQRTPGQKLASEMVIEDRR